MTTKALVDPTKTVTFRGGPRLAPDQSVNYSIPRDTCDPRYRLCIDHHVACDCREAEMAEDRNEWRHARKEQQEAFDQILAGHPTRIWSDEGNTMVGCQCTGCQLARALHIYPAQAER